jgi:prepilin-type N-terminal cleavage/methylation domain-containing protein
MALTKGFSLVETLVAVAIASIATMALMRVVSHASTTSSKAIARIDASILMSLVTRYAHESGTIGIDEELNKRYTIDHPLIREVLQSTEIEIIVFPKENLTFEDSLSIQKVILKNSDEKRTFFRITSTAL